MIGGAGANGISMMLIAAFRSFNGNDGPFSDGLDLKLLKTLFGYPRCLNLFIPF